MTYIEKYQEWLNSSFITKKEKEELLNMSNNEIKEAFSLDLEFGTAGIRGIMGLGTNRMNKYTISKVTEGLANYLTKKKKNPVVVIAYDTRNNSKSYAKTAALILNYHDIKTYIFNETASTPELSFAVTYLKADAGIVITSSHNASIYNGYKVYNNKGSQIVSPEDTDIINEINQLTDLSTIKQAELGNKLYNILTSEIRKEFIDENCKVLINKDIVEEYSKEVKITYTPLHGTGIRIAPKIFNKFKVQVNYVKEQFTEDGGFPFAKEPNPEYEENYNGALKYAKENNSDVIIASDPDSDRIGLMIKTNDKYELINGNVIGALFAYYLLENKKNLKDKYIVRSIVTSNLIDKIAKSHNVEIKECLTGCKNIANLRNEDTKNYIFGYEESLGYMFDIKVNDKNAFSSIIFLIEILSYLKSIDKTIYEYISEIYQKYGFYYHKTISLVYEGLDGMDKMNDIMSNLRDNNLFDEKDKIDYKNKRDRLKTNALKFILDDNSYFMVRPSGTEPKIKIYIISFDTSMSKAKKRVNEIEKIIKEKVK
ncbi:MAG: phospho-sugar mutase [Bacilli bacterium]|nr:phospho-sugar mutase [Bacilli bacterium]